MKNYFENKITYNQISFYLTDKATIDEREIHTYHEILFYIDGDTELLSADGRRKLKKPSIIIIPEETYHFLNPKNSKSFARLKISFPANILSDTPLAAIMSKMKVIEDFSDETALIFDKLCNILKSNHENVGFYAYSAFLMLITELDMRIPEESKRFHHKNNRNILSVEKYISENLSSELSINFLAKAMHISPSGITHLLKKEFGIPIHKYIMQKRLIYARRLINEGEQPTKIYADAGFKDYSSFYKAYVNYFGHSPSKGKYRHAHL